MKIDINELKTYLRDPFFPNNEEKTSFVVLEDMKAPTDINAGGAFIARSKLIPIEWSTKDLANYIKRNYSSFAFYEYVEDVDVAFSEPCGKIRFGSPKLEVTYISDLY